jgi:hypothetical protein
LNADISSVVSLAEVFSFGSVNEKRRVGFMVDALSAYQTFSMTVACVFGNTSLGRLAMVPERISLTRLNRDPGRTPADAESGSLEAGSSTTSFGLVVGVC